MKYLVTNIKWDTDGEDVDLPTEIIVELDAETEEHRDNYEKLSLLAIT